jgi:hypothetical protein
MGEFSEGEVLASLSLKYRISKRVLEHFIILPA